MSIDDLMYVYVTVLGVTVARKLRVLGPAIAPQTARTGCRVDRCVHEHAPACPRGGRSAGGRRRARCAESVRRSMGSALAAFAREHATNNAARQPVLITRTRRGAAGYTSRQPTISRHVSENATCRRPGHCCAARCGAAARAWSATVRHGDLSRRRRGPANVASDLSLARNAAVFGGCLCAGGVRRAASTSASAAHAPAGSAKELV